MHWFYSTVSFSKSLPSFQSQHWGSLPRWPWANNLWGLPPGTPTASASKQQQASPPKALVVQNEGTLPHTHRVSQQAVNSCLVLHCANFFKANKPSTLGFITLPSRSTCLQRPDILASAGNQPLEVSISTDYRRSPEGPGLNFRAPESAGG